MAFYLLYNYVNIIIIPAVKSISSSIQKQKIFKTSQAILDTRSLYPDSTLTELYNEITMPIELWETQQENDKAGMRAYSLKVGPTTESNALAKLIKMYDMKSSFF